MLDRFDADQWKSDGATIAPIQKNDTSALDTQEGGTHYKDRAIQPVQYIHANGLDYFQGNVVKYVTRWREKGGIADLRKAIHYLEMYIEFETKPPA